MIETVTEMIAKLIAFGQHTSESYIKIYIDNTLTKRAPPDEVRSAVHKTVQVKRTHEINFSFELI